jgi:acetoin utilization deacetylase AcuC-like enzyme
MVTGLFTHPACLFHDNGPGHPESPERLKAILNELEKRDFAALQRREAPRATVEQIARVHERGYVERILYRVPQQGYAQLDPDTALSPHSSEAALRAAGAIVMAIDEVLGEKIVNGFCAVRPPGHHAERTHAMGFCLFNNIAIGAAHALVAHNLKRIAIVDFDVHHGNGTEEWAKLYPEILFLSSHQFPFYPGSGLAEDRGPHGNIVNIPLAAGTDGIAFRHAIENFMVPAIADFTPELIMISAGFDAHRDDPLANLRLTEGDFAWITAALCKLAGQFCRGRIVSTLEGGYDLDALAKSAGAHVKILMTA